MKKFPCNLIISFFTYGMIIGCNANSDIKIDVFETSASGHKLSKITEFSSLPTDVSIILNEDSTYQTITGFGGSFTEASAHLLNHLGKENRNAVLEAYFGDSGAKYSLTRTHINSCDFSLSNYAYAPIAKDKNLEHFSIKEDMDDIIPMIKDAMSISKDGFKIISSPWTAPPWMKNNNDWRGGKLLPEYYETWALYFSKYINAYKKEGINIWGVTVENEPLGNDSNWESMHYTPQEMNDFVKNHLGPKLNAEDHNVKILGYDQNRDEELYHWVDAMYDDPEAKKYFDGTAVHWYASTYDYFPEALQYAHNKAPEKYLIQSEACVDAEVPKWKDDNWYWSAEATDWGWDWAPDDKKYLHPKYVPVHRYARDIIGCLNNWVNGWVDWNMVLDRQGGPNWAKNWCVAPVIADTTLNEVYYTPLYYTLAHFSRFIRPDAVIINSKINNDSLMTTAAKNPDGSIAVVLFNPTNEAKGVTLKLKERIVNFSISSNAIQSIIIHP
jgi:glucosylceramidase